MSIRVVPNVPDEAKAAGLAMEVLWMQAALDETSPGGAQFMNLINLLEGWSDHQLCELARTCFPSRKLFGPGEALAALKNFHRNRLEQILSLQSDFRAS